MMNTKVETAVFIALLAVASASLDAGPTGPSNFKEIKEKFESLQAKKHHVAPLPNHVYGDCGADAHLHLMPGAASLLQERNVPGAGVDKFKPFKKVLKDGFLDVDCVKDYMYYRGDKFGDNKHDYKLGPVSNVSIVHYEDYVAKEDRAEMTQKKCFEFCRTVPNMGFFGIVNGRGCYCTPYYTPMESDSSQCDAVCEGDKSLVCGGKSKSSIFAMHMCDSTEDDLKTRFETAKEVKTNLDGQESYSAGLSKKMQAMAEKLQKSFGAVGDSSATGLMQDAKVFAGTLVHKAEDVAPLADKLGDLMSSASKLKGFGNPATVTSAERIMEGIDETVAKASDLSGELSTLDALATGQGVTDDSKKVEIVDDIYVWQKIQSFWSCAKGNLVLESGERCNKCVKGEEVDACTLTDIHNANAYEYLVGGGYMEKSKKQVKEDETALKQYYPVMYFVDKEFEDVPTTCSGGRVGKPIVGESAASCAGACDANIHSCVGFQYFQDGDDKLCFLFSGFSTGFYYTGCGKDKLFLQANGTSSPFEAKCFAKLSKFEGTTLKPNPSGKCAQCFKELTKADRCYKK